MTCYRVHEGSSDGEMVMVRVLTSHQCGLGSNPGPGIIGGLMLVLALLQGLFSTVSGLHPSTKTNTFKFQFGLETVDEESLCGMYHCKFLNEPCFWLMGEIL